MTVEPGPPATAIPEAGTTTPAAPPTAAPRHGAPRALIITLGLAAAVIVAGGLRAIPGIVGPVFLALVLTITVDPIRAWMIRRGMRRWAATLTVVLAVYGIIIGLVVATIYGVARFATLMPQYADQIQEQLNNLSSWLNGLGVSQADVQHMLSDIDSSRVVTLVENVLAGVSGVLSEVLLLLVLAIFLAVDGAVFGERMAQYRAGREPILAALTVFAKGTRKYFGVATIFGGIVAILDGIALLILGIPAAGLWALLAFVTNYVPNIGFIIGLIPPAVLGPVSVKSSETRVFSSFGFELRAG